LKHQAKDLIWNH